MAREVTGSTLDLSVGQVRCHKHCKMKVCECWLSFYPSPSTRRAPHSQPYPPCHTLSTLIATWPSYFPLLAVPKPSLSSLTNVLPYRHGAVPFPLPPPPLTPTVPPRAAAQPLLAAPRRTGGRRRPPPGLP